MAMRKYERYKLFQKVNWDFFSHRTGAKSGYLSDISQSGCMLKTFEAIEHRRWIRLMLNSDQSNIAHTFIGRIARCEEVIEVFEDGATTLFRYGVELTHPSTLASQDLDLILALSNRNLTVRSCLIRNIKSSFRPGSLA